MSATPVQFGASGAFASSCGFSLVPRASSSSSSSSSTSSHSACTHAVTECVSAGGSGNDDDDSAAAVLCLQCGVVFDAATGLAARECHHEDARWLDRLSPTLVCCLRYCARCV
jgi:hypothetical protein